MYKKSNKTNNNLFLFFFSSILIDYNVGCYNYSCILLVNDDGIEKINLWLLNDLVKTMDIVDTPVVVLRFYKLLHYYLINEFFFVIIKLSRYKYKTIILFFFK